MFNKLKTKMDTGLAIAIIILCTLIFITLIPYTIHVINQDFEEKASVLAKQYSKCLDMKFKTIKNSASVIVSEYGSLFTPQTAAGLSISQPLTEIKKASPYLEGIVIVLPDSVLATDPYCGGSALYANFGKQPFSKLCENKNPQYLINNEVISSGSSKKMIYAMPVKSDGEHTDYFVLIFFDPLELIRSFKFEENWFLDKSSIVLVLKDKGIFQMRERFREPLVNSERSLSNIPDKKFNEYIVTYSADDNSFSSIFYINKTTVLIQSVIIIAVALLLLALACVTVMLCVRRYSRRCERRLNKLIHSMDNYIQNHTEEHYD